MLTVLRNFNCWTAQRKFRFSVVMGLRKFVEVLGTEMGARRKTEPIYSVNRSWMEEFDGSQRKVTCMERETFY